MSLDLRALGVGEIDIDPVHKRARRAPARENRGRRRRTLRRTEFPGPGSRQRGHGVSVVQSVSPHDHPGELHLRSEEHTSELKSLMRISYAVFCWKITIHSVLTEFS